MLQVLVCLVAVILTWTGYIYPRFFDPLRRVPLAKTKPPVGRIRRFFHEPQGNELLEYVDNIPNDGLIRYRGLLGQLRILLTNPKVLQEAQQQKTEDIHIDLLRRRRLLGPLVGEGLLTVPDGELHMAQKKGLGSAFAPRHIKELYPIYWAKTYELIEEISKQLESATKTSQGEALIETKQWAGRVTLDIIGVAALGHDFNTVRVPDSDMVKIYRRGMEAIQHPGSRTLLSLLLPDWIARNLPIRGDSKKLKAEEQTATKLIRNLCRTFVDKNKSDLEENPKGSPKSDIISVASRSSIFTDQELVDQMMTFLAAGHETTASALSWALLLLSRYPNVQTRLRQEIREVLQGEQTLRDLDATQLNKVSYLSAVCEEILRVRPPIPRTIKITAKPITLGGQIIPAGIILMNAPWAINRSTAIWGSDAGDFNPERWMTSETNNAPAKGGIASAYGIQTFSHGPRSCIGQGFAFTELKILVAGLVSSFEMRLQSDDVDIDAAEFSVTASPTNDSILMKRL